MEEQQEVHAAEQMLSSSKESVVDGGGA